MNARGVTLSALSAVSLLLLVAGSACFSGCSSDPSSSTGVGNPGLTKDEEALVDDGDDATDTGATASTMIAIPTYAFAKQADILNPNGAATVAVFSADLFGPHSPACVTTTHAAASPDVQYVFADCTGPFGLEHLNGEIDVTFVPAKSGNGIDFTVTTPGLTLNSAPVTLTDVGGNIVIDDAAGTRTLTWSGTFASTSLRGYPITHTVSASSPYTIVADTGTSCVTVSGSSSTTISAPDGDHGFTMDVSNYVHCGPRAACPTGGTITLTRLDGKLSITVEFEPGRLATITTPHGTVPNWPLKCS